MRGGGGKDRRRRPPYVSCHHTSDRFRRRRSSCASFSRTSPILRPRLCVRLAAQRRLRLRLPLMPRRLRRTRSLEKPLQQDAEDEEGQGGTFSSRGRRLCCCCAAAVLRAPISNLPTSFNCQIQLHTPFSRMITAAPGNTPTMPDPRVLLCIGIVLLLPLTAAPAPTRAEVVNLDGSTDAVHSAPIQQPIHAPRRAPSAATSRLSQAATKARLKGHPLPVRIDTLGRLAVALGSEGLLEDAISARRELVDILHSSDVGRTDPVGSGLLRNSVALAADLKASQRFTEALAMVREAQSVVSAARPAADPAAGILLLKVEAQLLECAGDAAASLSRLTRAGAAAAAAGIAPSTDDSLQLVRALRRIQVREHGCWYVCA